MDRTLLKVLLFALIGISLIFPVFAQDILNTSQSTDQNPTWHLGIFSIIGGFITLLGILLTLRFLYIDKRISKKIKSFQDRRDEFIENMEQEFDNKTLEKNDLRGIGDTMSLFDATMDKLERNKLNNRHTGLYLDIICMTAIVILGIVATLGFFENNYFILPVAVSSLGMIPVIHFIIQIRKLEIKKN